MLIRYFYPFIILVYLSGCNETYEPYLVHAYHKTKPSNPIKRFSSGDYIPELSNEWKEALGVIKEPRKVDLEDNIKQLAIEDRDRFWRLLSTIPPAQQPLFLKALSSFNKDKQANLLDIILHLAHEDEELIKVVLSGNLSYLPAFQQINLSNMVQNLKAKDQTLLFSFLAKLGY